MSIYAKLSQARVKLQKENLKKTGNNRSFKYFELKDFLPRVNEIFDELKMCAVVRYSSELATLTVYDCEKDESIEFTSPMVQKALPSGTEIQNLGAIQTYQRRYLYLTALEIVEDDLVDSMPPETPPSTSSIPAKPSQADQKTVIEKLKDGLQECKDKQELEQRYAKQLPWLEQNHSELIDEYNSFYDECLFNLNM